MSERGALAGRRLCGNGAGCFSNEFDMVRCAPLLRLSSGGGVGVNSFS